MLSAAWQGADTRRGAATRHVTRKRSSPRSGALPEAERLPPPPHWLLSCFLGHVHACVLFFFFWRIYLKNFFFIEGNCFAEFCCFLTNLNMNQP